MKLAENTTNYRITVENGYDQTEVLELAESLVEKDPTKNIYIDVDYPESTFSFTLYKGKRKSEEEKALELLIAAVKKEIIEEVKAELKEKYNLK